MTEEFCEVRSQSYSVVAPPRNSTSVISSNAEKSFAQQTHFTLSQLLTLNSKHFHLVILNEVKNLGAKRRIPL
jgi:hypothetical protein